MQPFYNLLAIMNVCGVEVKGGCEAEHSQPVYKIRLQSRLPAAGKDYLPYSFTS